MGLVTLSILIGIAGMLIGIAGLYVGYVGYKFYKKKDKFGWDDIEKGARDIINNRVEYNNKELRGKEFIPDAILTFSGPASIVANLAMAEAGKYLPIYLVLIEDIKRGPQFSFRPNEYYIYESSKWRIYIPHSINELKEKKILIIDHNTLTGDTLKRLVKFIITEGDLSRDNIRTVSLICTKIAIDADKAPDGIWQRIDVTDFYFPWGKGY